MGSISGHGQLRWDKNANNQNEEAQYIVAWSLGVDQSISSGYINYRLDNDQGDIHPIVKSIAKGSAASITNALATGTATLEIAAGNVLDTEIPHDSYYVALVGGYGRPDGLPSGQHPVADVYITALPRPLTDDQEGVVEVDKFDQEFTLTINAPSGVDLSDPQICLWYKVTENEYKWKPLQVDQVLSTTKKAVVKTDQIGHFSLMSNTPAAVTPIYKGSNPLIEETLRAAEAAAQAAKSAAEAAQAAVAVVRSSLA